MFQSEKRKLRKIFPRVIIEHVGSTSIPKLGGKGIIDIAIRISKSKLNKFIKKLEKLGYESVSDHPITNNSAFLQKRIKDNEKERRIHIHLVFNETFWESFILFKKYLTKHKAERDTYAKIKMEGAKQAKGKAEKYRKYKKDFLEKTMKKAREELECSH